MKIMMRQFLYLAALTLQLFTRAAYVAVWWRVVETTFIKVVSLRVDDLRTVELLQDGQKCSSVPVVCDSTAVVAFSRQVRQSSVLNVLQSTTSQALMMTMITK